MKSRSVFFSSFAAFILALSACTQQQATESQYESHEISVEGIDSDDGPARAGSPAQSSPASNAGATKEADPEAVSTLIEPLIGSGQKPTRVLLDLYEYGVAKKNSKIQSYVLNQFDRQTQQPGSFSQIPFSQSPYAELFIAQSKPQFMSATKDLQNEFDKQKTIIMNLLQAMEVQTYTVPLKISLSDSINRMATFISDFETGLNQAASLKPAIRDGIRASLYERFWMKLPEAQALLAQYNNSTQLNSALTALTEFMSRFEIQLEPAEVQKLEQARQVGQTLASPLSDRETLTMLIDIWESLPPEERAAAFATASPELHEFLASRSEKKRDCLKRRSCKNLFLKFARSHVILPKLRKYGLDKIQAQVNTSAIQTLNENVEPAARAALKSLPTRLRTEIFAEIDKEYIRFSGYRENYDNFARSELQTWFEKKFETGTIPFLPQKSPFDPEAFANNLSASGLAMQKYTGQVSNRPNLLGFMVANQILAHGGFDLSGGRAYPSLLSAQGKPINVQQFSYPRGQFGYKRSDVVELTVAQRNSLLRTFRQTISLLKDWQKNVWDSSVKKIKVGEFFANIPAESVVQEALPKDAFLALAVGNLTSFLYDLDRPQGPLFYMCPEGNLAWVGKTQSCASPTTLVSIADLPARANPVIHAEDHARFLIEVLEFMKLVDQLQQSRSPYLTKRTNGRQSPLAQLRASKAKLTELAVGLSNFLSHVLTSEDGHVCETYDTKSRTCMNTKLSLSQYSATIRALSMTSRHFALEPYAVVAKKAFEHLNSRTLGARRFYNVAQASVSDYAEVLIMVDAVSQLSPSPELQSTMQALETNTRRRLETAAAL